MKYTTLTMASLALGLVAGAAFADGATPVYTENFNSYPAWTEGAAFFGHENTVPVEEGSGWYAGSEDDQSKIVVKGENDKALQLNTESSTMTNKFDSATAGALNAAIAGDGAYFEMDVKFVASDSLDAGVSGGQDDAKFALYAYCSGEDNAPTNLVVFHAYYDSEFNMLYTNDVTDIAIDTDELTHVRIDMTQVEDDGKMLNAFTVKVGPADNAQLVETANAYDSELGSKTGSLFLTAEDWGITANQAVSSLAFKGTGDIDNIAVGTVTAAAKTHKYYANIVLGEQSIGTAQPGDGDHVYAEGADLEISNPAFLTAAQVTGLGLEAGTYYVSKMEMGETTWNFTYDGTTFAAAQGNPEGVTLNNDTLSMTITAPAGDGDSICLGTITITKYTPPAALIIRVAGVDASSVTVGDSTITIATTDKPLVYIAGVAATVGGEAGAWTVDTTAITEDSCVSIVKDEAIAAVGHKWYENPTRVGWVSVPSCGDGAAGYNANLDTAGNYICGAFGFTGQGHVLTSIADILAGGDNTTAKITWATGNDMRGSAVSTRWGVVLKGTASAANHVRAYPIGSDGSSPLTVTLYNHENLEVIPDSFYFSADGTCFYGNAYQGDGAGDGLNVYKFVIPAGGFVDGMTIKGTLLATIAEEIRCVKGAVVNGKEYLYVKSGTSVYIVDPSTGSSEKVWTVSGSNTVRYGDIAVAGDHVYYFDYTAKVIKMYNLDKTTGWITKEGGEYTEAVKTISANEIGVVASASNRTSCDMLVTDDEEYMIFLGDASFTDGWNQAVCLVKYTTPVYTVTFKVDDADFAVSNVVGGAYTAAPVPAPAKEGFTFVNWTNATYTTGFDFANTAITEDLVLFANFANAAKPLAILIAGGADPVEYTDLHEALVAGSAAGSVVELLADVDLAGVNWVPVANFLGKFDGKGHKISNLTITMESGSGAGLFGDYDVHKDHAGICNFTIENVSITAPNVSNVGAVAAKNGTTGMSGSGIISNVTVCGSINITGASYVGGLVGHNEYHHIIDCHVIGDGAATSVIGWGEVNEGAATGSGQIGGLVGMSGEGNMHIWNCSVENVSVKGTGLVGAIWGRMHDSSKMVGCTATDVNVYCAANVETAEVKIGTLVGGFVGGGLAPVINCTATNVKLYTLDGTPVDDRWTGTVAEGKNVARGTGVAGDAFTFRFSNPKLTAGTFEVMSDATVTSLAGWCQTGYGPVANGDGTYTIMQTFTVTVAGGIENGTVSVDKAAAAEGETVTVTATPAANYELDTITTNGFAITGTTFVMPAENVTVAATFKAAAPAYDIDLGDGCGINGLGETGAKYITFTSIDIAEGTVGILAGEIKTADGGSVCTLTACEELGGDTFPVAAKVVASETDGEGIITITGDISEYDTLFFTGIGPAAAE